MLIESRASITEFEGIQSSRQAAIIIFEKQMKDRAILRQEIVKAWLCPFDCETQQETHQNTRSVCKHPGRWLLESAMFQDWLDPSDFSKPLLWLNGIPGAGRTFIKTNPM